MTVLGVILARAGSKGLPGKCMRDLCGRPLIAYTFDHAKASRRITDLLLSTDSQDAKTLARRFEIEVVDRPADLASDTATVDAAARHAVENWEKKHDRAVDAVVLIYGNIPIRKPGLLDQAVEHLRRTAADSVRSVAPVTKQHPDWIHRLDGDRMIQFRPNSIYRRQDLEPLYYHDGAAVVVTRAALFGALETPHDKQSFLGRDRRAIVCEPDDAVDVDAPLDLASAAAILNPHPPRPNPAVPGRAFMIAEAGVNHNGSLETALRMIDAAKSAGADAVKFQMFRADELSTAHAPTATYQKESTNHDSQRTLLAGLELSDDAFAALKRRCDEQKIVFLATPFGPRDVERLTRLGRPAAIKIASTDLTNRPLLDAALKTDAPLILSTGAATAEEIRETVRFLRERGAGDRVRLLHCVCAYPTPLEHLELRCIPALQREFGLPVGLSDHTTSTATGAWAVAAGACVLEKHFTLDRTAPGPDHAMSLTPAELAAYVRAVREAESALGEGRIGMQPVEEDVRTAARKSVVAARAIPADAVLTADVLTVKRPGTGIPPSELPALVGRRTKLAIAADTMLTWAMIQ